MAKHRGKQQNAQTNHHRSIPLQIVDLIDTVKFETRELAQATEYVHLAMVSNAEYLGEYVTGILGTLELSAHKLQQDVEELSREAYEHHLPGKPQ